MTLHTSPPPGSGAIVAATLRILDQVMKRHGGQERNHSQIAYDFVEASKFAFAKRSMLGDDLMDEAIRPDIEKVLNEIKSQDWMDWVMTNWNEDQTSSNTTHYGAEFQYVPEDHGTSHISILGPNGDAVSVTSTVNTYFGSGVMSESTGIIFNNQMDDFSTPNTTNNYGIPSSSMNFIKPFKHPMSSMSPSIVVDDQNRVRFVVGASGGPRIISAVAFVRILV